MELMGMGSPRLWVEMGMWCMKCSVPYLMCCLSLAVLFLVYFYAPVWGVRRVPGPPITPIVGHLQLLAQFGPDVFRALAKQYGPIFRFHMGRRPLVMVADPELCREVGMKKFKDIKNRSKPSPITGSSLHEKGLFLTRDSRWASMRNAIIPLYQPSHLSSLVPTMQSIVERATCNLADREEGVNLSHLSLRMAIDVIGKTAFGVEFGLTDDVTCEELMESEDHDDGGNEDQVSAFLRQHMYSTESLKMGLNGSLSTVLGLLLPSLQKPCRRLLQCIPGTADRKLYLINENLRQRIDRIVAKRVREMDRGAKDFLSALLMARDTEVGRKLFSYDYVSALTYEHLLAGTATTSFTLSSVVYLLCKHSNVEKKLVHEIDAFGPRNRVPTAEQLLTKFPYLDQVVKEAMRFYTVSPLVARETSREVEVGGYLLPKGTWVWLALGVLAKDPKSFPDPDVFRPERFEPGCAEDRERHPYAHIPFGLGPRTCIGQKFALQQIKLSLLYLYRHYVITLSPGMESPPELEYGLVLNFKHGVKVQATIRE